jgi:hypothetical protein
MAKKVNQEKKSVKKKVQKKTVKKVQKIKKIEEQAPIEEPIKKKGRKKLVDDDFRKMQAIKSGHIIVDNNKKEEMPNIFSIKSKHHTRWLVNQILSLKIKTVESKLGFDYKVFESVPDEILVKEHNVGCRVVFVDDINFDKVKETDDGDQKATKSIIPDFYTVGSIKNDYVVCYDDGKSRVFNTNSVFLIEKKAIGSDIIQDVDDEEETVKRTRRIKRKK